MFSRFFLGFQKEQGKEGKGNGKRRPNAKSGGKHGKNVENARRKWGKNGPKNTEKGNIRPIFHFFRYVSAIFPHFRSAPIFHVFPLFLALLAFGPFSIVHQPRTNAPPLGFYRKRGRRNGVASVASPFSSLSCFVVSLFSLSLFPCFLLSVTRKRGITKGAFLFYVLAQLCAICVFSSRPLW